MYVGVAVKEDKVGEISLKSVGIEKRDPCALDGGRSIREQEEREGIGETLRSRKGFGACNGTWRVS